MARRPVPNTVATSVSAILSQLEGSDVQLDAATYADLLRQCIKEKSLPEGKRVHALISKSPYAQEYLLGNLLVQMYSKSTSLEDASLVFQKMQQRNSFSWNIMVAAYSQNGHLDKAMRVFERMPQKDVVSWTVIISAYVRTGDLLNAKSMFDTMPERSVVSWNTIIAAYAHNGHLAEARNIFDAMPQRSAISWNTMIQLCAQRADAQDARKMLDGMPEPDVISWTTMIAAYARSGQMEDAKLMFDGMPKRDVICWTTMVVAYAQSGNTMDARIMFERMPLRNVVSWNAIVAAYAQTGHLEEACALFKQMPQQNVVSWNSMIQAYAQKGHLEEAKSMFEEMGERDVVSWTIMLGAYAQNGHLEEARGMFQEMPQPNLVSWNAMISAYAQNDHPREALELSQIMDLEGVKADETTFVSVLYACTVLTAATEGKLIHAEIVSSGRMLDPIVGNALVNFYGKCGRLQDAQSVFDKTPNRDVVSWNGLVTAYAQNGHMNQASELLQMMELEGIPPNDVTFVSILSACSHAGTLVDGLHYFVSMRRDHDIAARGSHYHCLIDLLGRSGRLEEAEELINSMPFDADVTAWRTLLGACGKYNNLDHGTRAAERIFRLEPQNPTPYVMLSNIHAALGNKNEVLKLRKAMENLSVKKQPGRSIPVE